MTTEIKYKKPMTNKYSLEYVKKTLIDMSDLKIHITWGFDEQQADGFHRSWTTNKFVEAISRVVKDYEELMKEKEND